MTLEKVEATYVVAGSLELIDYFGGGGALNILSQEMLRPP